jgi:nitrite reductase/ring-hydroxylating ferredoxin subunit|tara:strand:+ start:1988 stop:2449 length:462 start_codon:yes stop_codon:yes gene_type:complete
MENKRRDFLKTACAPVVFSMFGVGMLEACSSGDDDGYGTPPAPGNASNSGEDQEEKSITIDLTKSNFSKISDVGGWMNYSAENMLLLRISDSEIRAFSNVCPHAGANNQWSHKDSKFTCGNHNRSFNDDCSGTSLKLTCYTTMIEGNTLTVTR